MTMTHPGTRGESFAARLAISHGVTGSTSDFGSEGFQVRILVGERHNMTQGEDMNIIVTGFTSEMTRGNPKVGFAPFSGALIEICTALGHEARMQEMHIDTNSDDLDWADVMIVGISPFNAIGARFMFGALDAIAQAKKHDCALLFCVSDWQTHLLKSATRSLVRQPVNITKWFMRNRTDFFWGVHNQEYLHKTIKAFQDRPWPETIIPVHGWFDPESDMAQKIFDGIPARRYCMMDPTPFTTALWNIPKKNPEEKSRECVMSALGDYSDWLEEQNISWPVRCFGGKRYVDELDENGNPTGERVIEKNKQIKEWEVNEHYADTWIGLSPKHRLSGTAWWRSRYHNILRAGSVLYGDKQETNLIGDAFNHTIQELEAMSTDELTALNKRQLEQFNNMTESREAVLEKIQAAIDRARDDLK